MELTTGLMTSAGDTRRHFFIFDFLIMKQRLLACWLVGNLGLPSLA